MGNNNYLRKFTEKYDGDDVIKYSIISISYTVAVFLMYFFKSSHYGLPDDVCIKLFAPVNMTLRKIYIIYLCCFIIIHNI